MAIYSAKIQAVQNGPYFEVQVNANSAGVAKRTIESIYKARVITNLREVGSGGGDSIPMSSKYWLLGFATFLYFAVTYWYFSIPLGILSFIIWLNRHRF